MYATSWMLIILLILIFGRFIAHSRVNHYRGKDYAFVGHCFLFAGVWIGVEGTFFYPETMEPSENIFFIIALIVEFGVPAAIFYVMARLRNKKMQRRYQAYIHCVNAAGITNVYQIASIMRLSVKHVKRDLDYMIRYRMIPNIFEEKRVFPTRKVTEIKDEVSELQSPGVAAAVTCSGCGATASVKPGVTTACEYCGNVLNDQVS